jgi:signal transduction histidine kinase
MSTHRSFRFLRGIYISSLLLISFASYSDTPVIDSLKQVTLTMKDSREKADNLFTIMRTYNNTYNRDSAWVYSEKLFSLASELGYTERVADAIYNQSMVTENNGELNKTLELITRYLGLVRPLNDTIRIAKGHLIYARTIKKQGNIDSSIYYLMENVKMGKVNPDPMMLIVSSNELGNIYQDMSVLDSAAYYYLESERICRLSGKLHLLGGIYNNLGKTFSRLKQYDEAKKYWDLSLEISRNNKDNMNVALILTNIGMMFNYNSETDSAIAYFDRALEIYKSYGKDFLEIGDLYNNYAIVYQIQENYHKALEYLKKAYSIYSRENYVEGMTVSLNNMGNIYTLTNQYNQAQVVLDSAYALAQHADSKINQRKILLAMSQNYFKSGNLREAYRYYEMYHKVYEQVFEIERTNKINELNIRYNKERTEKENLTLNNRNLEVELALKKKTYQSNIFLFTGIGIVLFATFLALYLRQRITISKQKIRQLEEEKKLMGAKLLVEIQEQERKRIATELHDGLGVLLSATRMQFSNIKDKSPENSSLIERAMQLLEQATGDVRKISHNMMPGLLTRLGLYEAVEDLFENMADVKELSVKCDIPENLQRLPENREIMLYRIIQEWVNNTLKYALAKNIVITMQPVNGFLEIDYDDNGIGYDAEKVMQSETASLGLRSIQSRVNFLNGILETDTAPGKGVRYRLRIPL